MKPLRVLSVLSLLLITAPIVSAQADQFAGRWKNIDPNTRGLTTLEIALRGATVDIQVWGRCHPRDCVWGHASGTIYTTLPEASNESSSPEPTQVISTSYVHSFAEAILIICQVENGRIQVELLRKYTDQSGRRNHRGVWTFARVEGPAPGK
jgi:hypothetical protein